MLKLVNVPNLSLADDKHAIETHPYKMVASLKRSTVAILCCVSAECPYAKLVHALRSAFELAWSENCRGCSLELQQSDCPGRREMKLVPPLPNADSASATLQGHGQDSGM